MFHKALKTTFLALGIAASPAIATAGEEDSKGAGTNSTNSKYEHMRAFVDGPPSLDLDKLTMPTAKDVTITTVALGLLWLASRRNSASEICDANE